MAALKHNGTEVLRVRSLRDRDRVLVYLVKKLASGRRQLRVLARRPGGGFRIVQRSPINTDATGRFFTDLADELRAKGYETAFLASPATFTALGL